MTGKQFKHRDLEIWKRGMALAKYVHELIRDFPKEERFGLYSQISRTSVSIPSNIAEGSLRRGAADFAHFLGIARGALAELDTQLELAHAYGYLSYTEEARVGIESQARQINAFVRKLTSEATKPPSL